MNHFLRKGAMNKFWVFSTVLLVLSVSSTAFPATMVFTDETSFLSAIQPGYYLEDFDAFTYGSFTGDFLDFGPTNGFSYTMSSLPDGLYSGDGNMSTNCLLYTSPSPRDATLSRMPSSA